MPSLNSNFIGYKVDMAYVVFIDDMLNICHTNDQ